MSVIKIKVLNVIGSVDELDSATTMLGQTGVFHPDNALSFYSDTTGFSPMNDANPYEKSLTLLSDTLKLIGHEKDLAGIRYPQTATLPVKDWAAYVNTFTDSIRSFQKERQSCEKQIQQDQAHREALSHFDGLGIDLDELKSCRFIQTRFGSLPEESFQKLTEPIYSSNPYITFFPAKLENNFYWGMYCAPNEQIEEIDRIFSGLSFEQVSLKEYSGTISSVIQGFAEDEKQQKQRMQQISEDTQHYWKSERQNFLGVYVWLKEKYTYFSIRRYAARYGRSFILTGWIPADKERMVQSQLDTLKTVKYAFDDAADPEVLLHSPPIKLHNKRLWQPFEFFINVYGLPSYNELDPTPFVAFTYFIFFGLMFADLGQGLCIALLGWLLWKKKKSGLGRVMVPCGISSAIVGTLFGSAFGFEHALDPLYLGLLKLPKKPISVMENPMTVVYFAIGLGIFMVLLSILTNIFASLKRRHYASGLFSQNGVAGFVFYVAVLAGFGGQALFGWNIVTPAYVVAFIIAPIISMIFQDIIGGYLEGKPDWKPNNWGETILQNFFMCFEYILSYLTNTISFIRVGAFVLVHAGMMMVIFQLAEMSGGVGYVITLIIGNAFVIALEGLLSGVQSLRLEFYELFSRFYDGSGRPYTPVIVAQES